MGNSRAHSRIGPVTNTNTLRVRMDRCLFIIGITILVRQCRQNCLQAVNGIELRVKLFLDPQCL